jgi:hypothetical protein
MMILSVAGTAEYLAWNRARWDAFRWLEARGVTLDQMDGGYEINAILAMRTGQKFLGKPGFAVRDDRYILAFNEVPGYTTLATFPYRRLLGPDGVVRAAVVKPSPAASRHPLPQAGEGLSHAVPLAPRSGERVVPRSGTG